MVAEFTTLVILLLALGLVWFASWQRKKPLRKIKTWSKGLSLGKHLAVFETLYRDINGFILSKEARRGQDAIQYVYGEIEFIAFIALVSKARVNKETVFYDLGHGIGKTVIACAMVFEVKKSIGVELFDALHQVAIEKKQTLLNHSAYAHLEHRIEFIRADLLNVDYKDATLIFINATGFIGDFWNQLVAHLEQSAAKATIITTTKPINSNQFKMTYQTTVPMSWGAVTAYLHRPR